jgi:hypothetical protein
MTREDLINQIAEEIMAGAYLGIEAEDTARNIICLVTGARKHLDYNTDKHQYEWEEDSDQEEEKNDA